MLNVLYIPTDKEAVEAALVLQRYCDAKFENGCKDCIHNLGCHESCGLSNELPCDYIIPDRIVKETEAKLSGNELLGGDGLHLILYGDPRTKKNSARILKAHANRRIVAPSEAFMQYQEKCLWQIKRPYNPITARVNVRCVYYMATRHKVDLANLIEATTDILVKAKVLADDNSQIVAAHDGSRVDYDKKNPRAEIWIEEMEADT